MHIPKALALAATCILAIASTSSAFSTSLVPSVLRSSAGACSFPRSLAPTSLVPAAASSLRVRAAPLVAMATKATDDKKGAAKKGAAAAVKPKKAAATADKPKRPLSAYFLFTQEKRASVKAAEPDISNTEIVKRLGELWRELPAGQKKPYEDSAAKAKLEYDAKYKLPESKDPKRPLSAYMIFSNSVRPKVKAANPTAAFGDIAKMIGAQWREMSPSAREEWKEKEAKGKKEYEAAVAK